MVRENRNVMNVTNALIKLVVKAPVQWFFSFQFVMKLIAYTEERFEYDMDALE